MTPQTNIEKAESYWLVEKPQGAFVRESQWAYVHTADGMLPTNKGELGWTISAPGALRFSRKQDAEAFILLHSSEMTFCVATEHMDIRND